MAATAPSDLSPVAAGRSRSGLALLWLTLFAVTAGVAVRLWHLSWPGGQVFDEVYFPVFAWKYLHRQEVFDVHPPLGKFLIALGELAFGDRPLGWRIVPALFGIANVWLFWEVGKRYFRSREAGMMAALLIAVESILVVYSRTGLMDGIQFFLVFAVFFAAVRAKRPRDAIGIAVLFGAAVAVKWIAAAVIIPVFYVLWRKRLAYAFALSLPWAFWMYILTVYAGQALGGIPAPWEGVGLWHRQAFEYHAHLTATHPWSSPWWSWPLQLRPVLFWYEGTEATGIRVITALGNPLAWWASGVAVLAGIAVCAKAAWREGWKALDHPVLPLLLGWGSAFLPWMLVHRVVFLYHYLPAYGFALLILLYFLHEGWKQPAWRPWTVGFLVLCVLSFLFFLPFATGLPLSAAGLKARVWITGWLY